MIHSAVSRTRHALLRWRQARARRAGRHDAAFGLLRRELYGDFARPMAAIHVDMAAEHLALGSAEEAAALLRLADEARLDGEARTDKKLLSCWAMIDQGKATDAEARLRAIDGEAMTPAQATKRRALLAEACLARKAPEAARESCGDAVELAPWRLVAEGEERLRAGDPAGAQARFEQARGLLAERADAPWLSRRLDRLLRAGK